MKFVFNEFYACFIGLPKVIAAFLTLALILLATDTIEVIITG